MQQTVQVSFLCLFLMIIYCTGMLYIQDFSYNLFIFIMLAIVYSSCSSYLAIQMLVQPACYLKITCWQQAPIIWDMGKLSCLIIQQLAGAGNLNLAIITKVKLAQPGQVSLLCFFFILEELAIFLMNNVFSSILFSIKWLLQL